MRRTKRCLASHGSWLAVSLALSFVLSTAAHAGSTRATDQVAVETATKQAPEAAVRGQTTSIDDHQVFAALEKHVDATMADGQHVRGVLLGYDPSHLIVENPESRQRYKLDRSLLVNLMIVAAPPPSAVASPPPQTQVMYPPQAPISDPSRPPFRYRRRTGALVTGSILTGVGTFLSIGAIVLYSDGDWFSRLSGTMTMMVALGHLGPGIPLLVVGAVAHRRHNEWRRDQAQQQAPSIGRAKPRWQPQFNVGRDAFSAGLQMQF